MSNFIPLYRAKKIDSDEYVEGYYCEHKFLDFEKKVRKVFNVISSEFEETESMGFIFLPCIKLGRSEYYEKIDPSTLAIHFPDMIDSEGNKIFASLNEGGKGGDIIIDVTNLTEILVYKYGRIVLLRKEKIIGLDFNKCKVIGIQQ